MNHDINVKKMRLNCFRQSKVPGEFMLQMRVPGGMVDAKYLSYVEHIANTWGDGNFHFGTRQTFDITGIKYENVPAVNEYLEQYIKEVDAELCGVDMDTGRNAGMRTAGVLWGYRDRQDLLAAGCTDFCSVPADISAVAERMCKNAGQ